MEQSQVHTHILNLYRTHEKRTKSLQSMANVYFILFYHIEGNKKQDKKKAEKFL